MASPEGEDVKFYGQPDLIHGDAEKWPTSIEENLRETVDSLPNKCGIDIAKESSTLQSRMGILTGDTYHGQRFIEIGQVKWTQDCENAGCCTNKECRIMAVPIHSVC